MTPITITGALTMTSLNGDGPQLLTEAAEFLNALAQMGVQMAVEINLRPVGAEKPEPPTYTTPAQVVEHVADSGAFLAGNPPFTLAPVDPTPAAPAQPDAPQRISPWLHLNREQRAALIDMEGRTLAKTLGHAPTMAEWDALKPQDYPAASGVAKTYSQDRSWQTLAASWSQS
jgi:hypothetical protein